MVILAVLTHIVVLVALLIAASVQGYPQDHAPLLIGYVLSMLVSAMLVLR